MNTVFFLMLSFGSFNSFTKVDTRLLDTKQQTIAYLFYDRVSLSPDGSFILAGEWSVWHFSVDGKLIKSFGRKGQGPTEFQYVQKVIWDGTYYWVVDGKTLAVKQFDKNVTLLKNHSKWYLQLLMVGNRFYAINSIDKKQKGIPGAISEVKPLSGFSEGKVFHPFSPTLFTADGNYGKHLLASDHEKLYVLNQLDAVITPYSMDGTKKFKGQTFLPPRFVGLPEKMIDYDGNIKKWMNFLNSFSKFTGIGVLDGKLVVAYEVPAEEGTSLLSVMTIGKEGKAEKLLEKVPGYFIGCYNHKIMVVSVNEDQPITQYTLQMFQ